MLCPHCGNLLELPGCAFVNQGMEGSRGNLSVTDCCGRAVVVKSVTHYKVHPYQGTDTVDDWGKKIKK